MFSNKKNKNKIKNKNEIKKLGDGGAIDRAAIVVGGQLSGSYCPIPI